MRRAGLFLVLSIGPACGTSLPVEAPVIAVTVGDAGASPIAIRPDTPERPATHGSTSLVGRWEGIGTQNDGQTWPLTVEVSTTESGVCATADYPSIPCRGEWICERTVGGVVTMREHLLDDSATRCVDNGTMSMHLDAEGHLAWKWAGQGQTAEGKLRRLR